MSLVADIFSGKQIGDNNFIGIIYGIMAALLYSGVILSNKFLKNISAMDSSIAQLSLATCILFPYVIYQGESWSMSSISLGALLILGIVHTGIAYLLYFSSMQELSAQKIAIFSYLDPIVAIILSTVFLAEPMSLAQKIGAVLILGSLFASDIFSRKSIK